MAGGGGQVRLERDGAIATVTLCRPERLNALDDEAFHLFGTAVREARADPGVKVIVLTGAGAGFCTGSDVAEQARRLEWTAERYRRWLDGVGEEVALALAESEKPTIAALNGVTVGGGLSLALACDVRLAADSAVLGLAFGQLGLLPDLGITYFLPRTVGLSRALLLLYRGGHIGAGEALAMGLVDEVVPAAELAQAVRSLAEAIVRAPALALALGRAALRAGAQGSLREALEREAAWQARCVETADHRRAVEAFLARKRASSQKASV